MSVLLLRFAAPMQSWGGDATFNYRRTEREPTKSGVIGLLAAALGRRRDSDISDLCRLKVGVRVDREGKLIRDYQTAWIDETNKYVINRYYLGDAVFLVAVESDDNAFINELEEAVRYPVFTLFLGRRKCLPTPPISLGVRDKDIKSALVEEPLLIEVPKWQKNADMYTVRMMCEADGFNTGELKQDVPISFDPKRREFGYRFVSEEYVDINVSEGNNETYKYMEVN